MNPSERKSDIENLSDFVEPCFYLGLNKNRKLPTGIDTAHTFNSFEYRLKQDPNDLSCHLQRMQFSITVKNRTELFAAICDLFIVLGERGLALRKRLLDTCSKVLNQEQLTLIDAHLNEKPLSTHSESLPDRCLFKKEVLEYVEIEEHSDAATKTSEDVLRIAESYIANSQFDTALEYMQTRLEHDQKNKALTLKLISLYRALNRADKFHSAFEKFSNNVATSLYWTDAKKHFSDQ